ncbi:protein mono-ADP-ribosyltransferase PARP14-like [Carassius carassius]|uniref:protein mono-ADP-ribosyltransferase PARP14-like n=1 Tax=Carassius carassius TaxID=217509 RepID=UPI0028694D67|nr:protein mono-ADP-ribosyltransferase PARP14-like [Carassius carassius]
MFQCLGLKKSNKSQTTIEENVHVKSHAVAQFIKDRKSQDWQDFMKSDEVKVSFDPKKPLIKLSGERAVVQPAVTFFKSLADGLYMDTLIIKKAGAKKYFMEQGKTMLSRFARENGFVAVLQDDDMLEEEKDAISQESESGVSSSCFKVYTMQIHHLTLTVSSGDITKENTYAIVNSSNKKFTLKSGVSKAILDGAGLQVEQELLEKAGKANDQQREIVTSSGNLPCEEIIHIVGCSSSADIQLKVLSVLMLCENRKFSSVAFPALGTGQGGLNPADVADAMINAVVEFASKKTDHVKNVEFLIFQSSMLADFHQSMLKSTKSKKSLSSRIKGESIVFKEIQPGVFQLCSETTECLSKASPIINGMINKKQMNKTIRDPAIAHFTKKELKMLKKMKKELKVNVIIEKKEKDPFITVKGLTSFVYTAESRIRDIIRKVEKIENRKRVAILTSSTVEWQYRSGRKFKPFDPYTNCDLEEAFNLQKTSVQIKINSEVYNVDIVCKKATRGGKQVELKRVQLKASLPLNWEDMEGQQVVIIELKADSQEFTDVEKEFRKTGLSNNIIKIERVQNCALWRNYMIKKEELEDKNKHKNNEKLLFHGTGPDTTDQINNQGFNRSFAGKNGAMYGNGTYFAVDPSYSVKGYSTPDAKGHKRIYLARVLVGDFTQGKKGLRTPPKRNSKGVDLYDSVTDKSNNPSMFVIFNDVQAYPEYLITFKKK